MCPPRSRILAARRGPTDYRELVHAPPLRRFVRMLGGPHVFSNALSPVQAAVVAESLRIVRSPFQVITHLIPATNGIGLTQSQRSHTKSGKRVGLTRRRGGRREQR